MKPEIETKLKTYSPQARSRFEAVRQLIFDVAIENDLGTVEETLKWGEPAYLVKGGSTVRIDWKPKDPEAIRLYFHCQTILIETFKEIYRDDFKYDGNRAIVIPLHADFETQSLSHCIELALKYHSVKHLELLGA